MGLCGRGDGREERGRAQGCGNGGEEGDEGSGTETGIHCKEGKLTEMVVVTLALRRS